MSAFKKKTIRFLWTSLVIVLALCIGVFAWITNYMIRESNNAINEIGDIYMQEMNRQMELHFSSIINLRLTQVESIIWSTPPESVTEYGPDMLEQLSDSANARGFNYLALYSTQGVFDVIYGEEVVAVDDTRFLSSMNDDENKVAVGTTASGNKTVLLGVSVGYPTSEGYPMKDGSRCTALVAGLPIEYFEQTMSLDVDESMIYSHIIEKDGDFVVRTADVTTENYFEWLEMRYAPEDGEAIQRMRSAIEQGEECFEFFYAQGERRHGMDARRFPIPSGILSR